ncbi:hypothetical protein FQN60_015956, partial [Etheostoma spectabile]
MSRHATDGPECAPSPPLPADHVLNSAAVLFPADQQAKLPLELSKAEVVDFINYFLGLHKYVESDTLFVLHLHKQTVHSVYIVQPKKKEVVKLLLKLLAPSRSHTASFKRVLLKEISELSNHIDRSQLTADLGGYLIYCHQSWVAFIKEIDDFVQAFLSVVKRLPSCISTLTSLSRLPLPSTFSELKHFCSTNEATFQTLRRELGLDDLLWHCESVVEKLRYPEMEPCYQAMAGTTLFNHTALDMHQNHSRITAAVEKVELLWQQAFSKARLQLQITEQIKTLLEEKLQPYKMEIAKDAAKAVMLVSEFKASIHTHAMALIRCAEDVIHTVSEIRLLDGQTRERWVLDLERLKEKLHSAASSWYGLVLCENFLQELLSGVSGDNVSKQSRNWGKIPAWRYKMSAFLKKNPPPDMEELVHLAHLSQAILDGDVQEAGKQMSQRCMTLRKLLISSGPVAVGPLQLALQWQYELLRSSHANSSADSAANGTVQDVQDLTKCEGAKEAAHLLGKSPSTAVTWMVSSEGKPPSLSSFDSGFDGAGGSQLETCGGREGLEGPLFRLAGTRDSVRPATTQHLMDNISDCEDHREEFGSVGNSSMACIQLIPKVTVDSLNLEIKVKRSAARPNNPWLSLPVDDLENSYTVTITQNQTPQKKDSQSHDASGPNQSNRSPDPPTQTDVLSSTQPRGPQSRRRTLHKQSTLEDPQLSPICNILSSTITDKRDKSICTTEGSPTLLWDSYDLHDQNPDAVDGVFDISLNDWDVKEQEDLREVEKILDRADKILEKEETVLAQEAVLDALLRSEDRQNQWPLWDSEDHLGVMSSSKLAEAGVLGLEDYLDPAESDNLSGPRSTGSASKTKASEDEGHCAEAATGAETEFHSWPDLLTELRKVHVLDELIMEENLKIHQLRRCEENPKEELCVSKPVDIEGPLSRSKEREVFRFQLEQEKREVEKLEKSLNAECKMKKHKDSARKVVKGSIMEKARSENKDPALCDELLSTSLVLNHAQAQDTCKTENVKILGPDTKEAMPQDLVQLPDSQCQDDCSGAEPSAFNSATFNITSDLREPPEDLGIQPEGCIQGKKLDGSGENASTSEMRPEDGVFDPGGTSHLPPAPKPRRALLPVNGDLSEHKLPHSTELQDPTRPSVAQDPGLVQHDLQDEQHDVLPETVNATISHTLVVSPNVKEHSSNNNNNHALTEKYKVSPDHLSEISTKDDDATPVVAACLEQPHLHPSKEGQTVSPADECPHQSTAPQPCPGQPLEFDPGGRDEQNEDSPMTDFKTPIVLDTGSGLMKAGFADQDLPNIIFPTIIGMPKYEEIMNGNLERETYIGHDAQHMRGVLALKHPIKNGIIRNWDEMEKIWHHTFQQLCVDPDEHPVLLTEAAMNPLENRQRMVEIMFECFNVPFTYVAMQAVLALYAAGRSTGVVFDSGDGVSHSVPVFEGYSLPHAVQRFPLAGVDVTMHLKKVFMGRLPPIKVANIPQKLTDITEITYRMPLVNSVGYSSPSSAEQGVCMRTTAEMEIVREMKEKCCCVAVDHDAELSHGGASCREMHYTMPDGQIVTLGTERFRAPEILFKPELIGRDHYGMHESRLQAEIKGLLPTAMGESVRVTSPKDRDFSVWRGGAVLAQLPTFSSAWISLEEYEEHGPQIVFRNNVNWRGEN